MSQIILEVSSESLLALRSRPEAAGSRLLLAAAVPMAPVPLRTQTWAPSWATAWRWASTLGSKLNAFATAARMRDTFGVRV